MSSTKARFLLFITMVLWASAFVGIRYAVRHYPPGDVALLRYLVASIILSFFFFKMPNKKKPTFKELLSIFSLGAVGFGIYNITLNYGELTIPSGIASFIVGQIPIIVVLFAMIWLKERPNRFVFIGILISFLGLCVIALGEREAAKWDIGILYVILTTICGGLYTGLQKPLLKKFSATEFTTYATWGGTLLLCIYIPSLINVIPHAPIKATLAIVYMGIFPGAIAYLMWSYIISLLPASQSATALYSLPIITTVMAWLTLGEIPATLSLLGGGVALCGAIITTKVKKLPDN